MKLRRRELFKVHQAVGVGVAAMLVVSALSGALLVLRDCMRAAPPACAETVGEALGLEALLARARAEGPDEAVTDITLPGETRDYYEFYFDDDEETVVYLARDGALLDRRETAQRLTRWLFRLHTGEIAGKPGEAAVFVAGAGLLVLTISGLWMILARRRARATKE